MLVKQYKCVSREPEENSTGERVSGCFNRFYGPEEPECCPYCCKKETLEMDKRDWNVELR